MRKIVVMAGLISSLLSSAQSFAQTVIKAELAELQPQIRRDDQGFLSCGIRAIVVTDRGDIFESYDFSIMAGADILFGTLKAGKHRYKKNAAPTQTKKFTAVIPAPIKFWIAEETSGKALNPRKIMPAESNGYVLEIADFVETVKIIHDIIEGKKMQFAIRYKDEPGDIIVSFSSALPKEEAKPIVACFNGVLQRIDESIENNK